MADILVIDDEESLAYSIQLALQRANHQCRVVDCAEAGLEEARRRLPDLALVDVHLPDMNGLELLTRLRESGIDLPVIVITGYGTISSAVAAMRQGAVDYIPKPLAMDELRLAVDRCLENRRIRNQLDAYKEAQQRESDRFQIIAACEAMREVLALAEKIASIPTGGEGQLPTVLLLGETGTGKEVIARHIHHRSESGDRPFVQVNCTAIPEGLFESELFGHEPGTFTSARSAKVGLLEMAHEGTLLLDEIGDMPLATQAKLLVAIESGRYRKLGSITERVARVRVMAATNADLKCKVERGEFRRDLFFRLKMFCIELPPLRDRGDDVFALADFFMDQFCRKLHKLRMRLAEETRPAMQRYSWPGNVRELANVLQRAILLNEGESIVAKLLGIESEAVAAAGGHQPAGAGRQSDEHRVGDRHWSGDGHAAGPHMGAGSHNGTDPRFDFAREDCTIQTVQRRLIESALHHSAGNISEAARLLGVSRGRLRHFLDKLGLDSPVKEAVRGSLPTRPVG